jgi:hypothetical protein
VRIAPAPILNVIAWSAVLAITFYPVHQYVVRKTGWLALARLCSAGGRGIRDSFVFIAGVAIHQFRPRD